MKRTNFEIPEHLMQRAVDALDAAGLHVIEYVKSGGFRFMVSEHPPITAARLYIHDQQVVPSFLRDDG